MENMDSLATMTAVNAKAQHATCRTEIVPEYARLATRVDNAKTFAMKTAKLTGAQRKAIVLGTAKMDSMGPTAVKHVIKTAKTGSALGTAIYV